MPLKKIRELSFSMALTAEYKHIELLSNKKKKTTFKFHNHQPFNKMFFFIMN